MSPTDLMMIQCAIKALQNHAKEQEPDDLVRQACSILMQIERDQRAINETVRRLEHGVQHRNDRHRA